MIQRHSNAATVDFLLSQTFAITFRVIKSFKDSETGKIYNLTRSRKLRPTFGKSLC